MSQNTRSYDARPRPVNWVAFFVCIVASVGLGLISAGFGGAWAQYPSLNVASVAPPTFVMFVVWPIVYLLMGVSFYAVIDKQAYTLRSQSLKNISVVLWVMQFLMVLALPFVVFRMELFMLSFVLAALITSFLSALAVINLKITTTASVLLIPCLVWTAFETYLMLIIAMNNW